MVSCMKKISGQFFDSEIAVLIPCYNESVSITQVILDFQKVLPNAKVYVYDNASTDDTAKIARAAGAIVRTVRNRGKGNVIRKMFSDIDADIYIMIDGDATYNPRDSVKMLQQMAQDKSDMVVAVRKAKNEAAYPKFHVFGNKLFNFIMKILFNSDFQDVFSGYRAFSRRFVKTFPVTTNGFDIEAELSIHALTLSIPYSEVESVYSERPTNSYSKLNTIKDGLHILASILRLFVDNKPLPFFGAFSAILIMMAFVFITPVLTDYFCGINISITELIFPLCIVITSILSLSCGLTLRASAKIQLEVKRLLYLSM